MKTVYQRAKEADQKYKGLATVKKNCPNEVYLIVKKIRERGERTKPVPSVKELMDNRIIQRLESIAENIPRMGYSMGSCYVVRFAKLIGVYDSCTEYSRSYSYRATHGRMNYSISLEKLRNFKVIAGIITFVPPGQKGRIKKCSWLETVGQKQYYRIIEVPGYLYKDYHARTMGQIKTRVELEKARSEAEKRFKKYQKEYLKQYVEAKKLKYGLNDSIKCGNCETGTRAFALRCHLDPEKEYKGSYLLKAAYKHSSKSVPYIERMIKFKISQI